MLNKLTADLNALGYPFTYSHFKQRQDPPCIVYVVHDSDTYTADDTVYSETLYVDIDLYVAEKNLTIEKQIKNILKEHEIAWSYSEVYIAESKAFKCSFSIEIIEEGS